MYLKCIHSCALGVLLPALVQAQTAPPSTPATQPSTPTQPGQVAQPTPQPPNQPTNPAQPSNPVQPPTQPGQVARPTPQPGQPAQPPNQPPIGQTAPFPQPLYRMDNVSRGLNLTQLQLERLNQMTQGLQDRYRNDFNNINNLTNLSPQERATRTQQLLQQYNTTWMTGAGNIFNPQQLNRYRQLGLQYGGFGSFTDPQVQRQLNLTSAQQQQLNAANQWSQQQLQNIAQLSMTDPNQAATLYRNYQGQWQTRLNGILTPDQQRQWQGMVGDPFSFPQNFPQR